MGLLDIGCDTRDEAEHTMVAPLPRSTESMIPFSPSGIAGSTGRFGHPNAPACTFPSTMSARHTAYWSPLRKPFVPSIGSNAHIPRQHKLAFRSISTEMRDRPIKLN